MCIHPPLHRRLGGDELSAPLGTDSLLQPRGSPEAGPTVG